MKKLITGVALLIAGLLAPPASAQQLHTSRITKNQKAEQHRINEGMHSGELTPREATRLEQQQVEIRHDKKAAKLDGVITPHERAYLKSEQAKAANDIYRQKHNAKRW